MKQAPVCWTDSAARASHCSTATWWTFRRRPADVRRSGAVAPEDAGLFSSPSRMPCGTSTRRSRGPASSLQLGPAHSVRRSQRREVPEDGEHPALVAERIGRYARRVGRENVIGGTDCGFGTWVGQAPWTRTSPGRSWPVWPRARAWPPKSCGRSRPLRSVATASRPQYASRLKCSGHSRIASL